MAITASGIVGVSPATLAAEWRFGEFEYFPPPNSVPGQNPTHVEVPITYNHRRHEFFVYVYAEPGSYDAGPPIAPNPFQWDGVLELELQGIVVSTYPLGSNKATFPNGTGQPIPPEQIKSRVSLGGYSTTSNTRGNFTLFVDNRNTGAAIVAGMTQAQAVAANAIEPPIAYLPSNSYSGQIDKVRARLNPASITQAFQVFYIHIWIGVNSYAA